ncbi:preprotein translocase subunit SecY [candidate division WWE3 bacterium RIFOXYC1_FULL_39_7]|uniref:Protein translocase subunit SecY n=2 Tax=Katanobacteria TaxID=422282 RepID=A0A1F4X480_UNCKA|nr:MAG: preprotein translocase subunit SecY [candidate division WWE3 bacterium RIFOXYC1_FULL_39_7]OGC76487.1 MAG: preprotein translocase subunit SecY [candidate division WWE3 bacterium RIFOXYD1_FULL_39_9]
MLNVFKFPDLRRKIFFTFLIIVMFRLFAHIPVPGVNVDAIRGFLQNNAFFGLFDLFSGGGFQNFSIVTLGMAPYINVSIIMQLLTVMIPSLEELSKEGEYGREKINMYTRLLTVPMALLQSYGIYFLLNRQGVLASLNVFDLVIFILTLTAGALMLVWLGELVTEYGIGNGISVLIFVSIIGRLPTAALSFFATLNADTVFNSLIFIALALVVIAAVVIVNEGTRNITIEYGRRGIRSEKIVNYLPIKVNQVSVVPIIFAVAIVMLPAMISGPLQTTSNEVAKNIGFYLAKNFQESSALYNVFYFLLVVGFTFFYTSVQFNSDKIAEDIKKRGGFVPGIRPGTATATYLRRIVNRITSSGALFLGTIAILPFLIQSFVGTASLTVGGTGLLIVVSVVLETIRQIESHSVSRSYESFLR